MRRSILNGDYRKALADAYHTGRLRDPRVGGFAYMYSVDAAFTTDGGRKIAFMPHVMV